MSPSADPFVAPGHNLNKLGRSSLGDATYWSNINALGLVVAEKKCFFVFLYIRIFKTCDPRAGPFSALEHNLNKLGSGALGDDTYQI